MKKHKIRSLIVFALFATATANEIQQRSFREILRDLKSTEAGSQGELLTELQERIKVEPKESEHVPPMITLYALGKISEGDVEEGIHALGFLGTKYPDEPSPKIYLDMLTWPCTECWGVEAEIANCKNCNGRGEVFRTETISLAYKQILLNFEKNGRPIENDSVKQGHGNTGTGLSISEVAMRRTSKGRTYSDVAWKATVHNGMDRHYIFNLDAKFLDKTGFAVKIKYLTKIAIAPGETINISETAIMKNTEYDQVEKLRIEIDKR